MTSTPPIPIIVNPASGGGRGARMIAPLDAEFRKRGMDPLFLRSEGPGEGVALVRKARETGSDRLLVVGGDGTVHEVANGLLTPPGEAPLSTALLPVGTGNDFHRMLGARKPTPGGALDALQRGATHPFDVGHVRWPGGSRYFVNLLGVGVDVEVLRRRGRFARLPGLSQYLLALASAVIAFEPQEIQLELGDGSVLRHRTLLTAVTVGPSVGGGFLLSPEADPTDGLLDLFTVEALSLLRIARHLPQVLRGTHASVKGIHMRKVTHLRLASPDGSLLHFELDGELMPEAVPWLEVEVRTGAFPILGSRRPEAPAGAVDRIHGGARSDG